MMVLSHRLGNESQTEEWWQPCDSFDIETQFRLFILFRSPLHDYRLPLLFSTLVPVGKQKEKARGDKSQKEGNLPVCLT